MKTDRDLIIAVIERSGGLVSAARLRSIGVGQRQTQGLLAADVLHRIRRGVHADAAAWSCAPPDERHRMMVRFEAATNSALVFGHASAAAMYGLPLIGRWPDRVHVMQPGAPGGSSTRSRVLHRGGGEIDAVDVGGIRITSIERTVIDLATAHPFVTGLAVVDAALRGVQSRSPALGSRPEMWRTTRGALLAELEELSPRAGRRRAERVVEAGDPRAESPGESLSRGRMIELEFALPELQVPFIGLPSGDAYVDFYWPGIQKIGEFDGRVKYARSQELEGRAAVEVVIREKEREDALRRRVKSFDRWTWDVALSATRFARFLEERGVPRSR